MKPHPRFHCLRIASTLGAVVVMVGCTGKSEQGRKGVSVAPIRHENVHAIGCVYDSVDTLLYNGFRRNKDFGTPFEAGRPFTAGQVEGYSATLDRIRGRDEFVQLKRFCDSSTAHVEQEALIQADDLFINGMSQQTVLVVGRGGQYTIYTCSSGVIVPHDVDPVDAPLLVPLFDPATPSLKDMVSDSPVFFIAVATRKGIGQYVIDSPPDGAVPVSPASTSEADQAARTGIYRALTVLEGYLGS